MGCHLRALAASLEDLVAFRLCQRGTKMFFGQEQLDVRGSLRPAAAHIKYCVALPYHSTRKYSGYVCNAFEKKLHLSVLVAKHGFSAMMDS